uniref:Major facilitator superfamily (MFS) profile domain-containing protein n=1 Tax=Spongospora subterranea TaxID=70186 RepID=A0A0H5REN1_9EUKA|eukprot:CRZ11992.1 hypothetical protein [Spongospora subterranea]
MAVQIGRGKALDDKHIPKDRFNIVYISILLLGCGVLFPYNTLISLPDFFTTMYPGQDADFILPTVLSYPSIIVVAIMIRYGHKVSLSRRIIPGFALITVIIAWIPWLATSDLSKFPISAFHVLVAVVFSLGICAAIVQSAALSFACKFPPIYTQALMFGQGLAGVGVCLIRMLTKFAVQGQGQEFTPFFYISATMSLIALAATVLVMRVPFTEYYLAKDQHSSANASVAAPIIAADEVRYVQVIKKMWPNALYVFSVFCLTFMVFPGMTCRLTSSYGIESSWFTLFLITIFNVCDTIGRISAGFLVIRSSKLLWIGLGLRLCLYPCFVLCKLGVLAADAFSASFVALLGISNGYLASVSMMKTSSYIDKHEEEVAGCIITFFLMAGIISGSQLAYLIQLTFPI